MPQLAKKPTKFISLTYFAATSMAKLLCILLLSGQTDSPCIAGWHVNEELSHHLVLVTIGLIPDIIMVVCIGIGLAFETSNIGADPGTIIYNFITGLLAVCSLFPFLGIEDCKSDNLAKIKLVGLIAAIAGVLHIVNGVICLLNLAPEESSEPEEQAANANPTPSTSSGTKPSTPKASRAKATRSK